MKKSIFREKSIERISSPEQFDEYVKVSNPSIWVLMFSIIILLAGFMCWSVFGRLESTVTTAVVFQGEDIFCYVDEEKIEDVSVGDEVFVNGKSFKIKEIYETPVYINASINATIVHILDADSDVWVGKCILEGEKLPDGTYSSEIIIDSIAPITFVTN